MNPSKMCRVGLYLWGRGLSGKVYDGLLFVEEEKFFSDSDGKLVDKYPAMVAEVRAPDGEVCMFHRTFLDPNGIGKLTGVPGGVKRKTPAMKAGISRGAAIRLCPPGPRLAIAEGIETSIAVHEARGVPVWCAIDANGLASIELPEEVRAVEIWADNDVSGVGLEAAFKAKARFNAEGRDVEIFTPPIVGSGKGVDWLDMYVSFGPRAFRVEDNYDLDNYSELGPLFSDLYNARKMVERHGLVLRNDYLAKKDGWYVFKEGKWQKDLDADVPRLAQETLRHLLAKASTDFDKNEIETAYKHLKRSINNKNQRDMLSMAGTQLEMTVRSSDWDRDKMLLNVANGVVDLHSATLRQAYPRDMCLKSSPVVFDLDAEAPRFLQFLDEVTDGDEDLQEYLQRICGYSLTGDTRQQAIFIHYGKGRNGKSVFLDTIRTIAGDYALQTGAETFMRQERTKATTPEIARLKGARLVCASEADARNAMSPAVIKTITGSEMIVARPLYEAQVEFFPEFKVHLATNYKPLAPGGDVALWRRLKLVPWTVSFAGREDRTLEKKLKAEASGILTWMVQGCLDWQQYGLEEPRCVREAIEEYRQDMDVIGQWLEECTDSKEGFESSSSKAYENYKEWCEESGRKRMNRTNFKNELADKGFNHIKRSNGRYFVGLFILGKSKQE